MKRVKENDLPDVIPERDSPQVGVAKVAAVSLPLRRFIGNSRIRNLSCTSGGEVYNRRQVGPGRVEQPLGSAEHRAPYRHPIPRSPYLVPRPNARVTPFACNMGKGD